jgi:hypothetical protein
MIRRDRPSLKNELRIIPGWALAIAAVVFVVIPVVFYSFVWVREPNPPPVLLKGLISFLPGIVLGFLALMIGYVNKDAQRRGMNRLLWTIVVIFVPNALGFILYFLLRTPIRTECPNCGIMVDQRANFCPSCRYSFHPMCSQCRSAVRPGDKFCATCGAVIGDGSEQPSSQPPGESGGL